MNGLIFFKLCFSFQHNARILVICNVYIGVMLFSPFSRKPVTIAQVQLQTETLPIKQRLLPHDCLSICWEHCYGNSIVYSLGHQMSAALFMTDSSVVIDALGNKYFCVSEVFLITTVKN